MIPVYVLFHSTNHALWGQEALTAEGIPSRTVPVPRQLSSDCGYCLQIPVEDAARARRILAALGVLFDRIAGPDGQSIP